MNLANFDRMVPSISMTFGHSVSTIHQSFSKKIILIINRTRKALKMLLQISDKKRSKVEYTYMHHHLPHLGETHTWFSAKLSTSFGVCAVSLHIEIARTNTTNRPDYNKTFFQHKSLKHSSVMQFYGMYMYNRRGRFFT